LQSSQSNSVWHSEPSCEDATLSAEEGTKGHEHNAQGGAAMLTDNKFIINGITKSEGIHWQQQGTTDSSSSSSSSKEQ
jgi:hypothetical protein